MTRAVLFGRPPREKARPIVVVNFDKYNPPAKAVNEAIRRGGPLTWLRWETTTHRDPDLLDLTPAQRWLWVVLLDLAGKQHRTPDGLRVVHMTDTQLAREADMPCEDVKVSLKVLWKRRRIRYTVRAGRRVSEETSALLGGDAPPSRHPPGGHAHTYAQTHTPSRAREEIENDEPYAGDPRAGMLRGEASLKTALHRRGKLTA